MGGILHFLFKYFELNEVDWETNLHLEKINLLNITSSWNILLDWIRLHIAFWFILMNRIDHLMNPHFIPCPSPNHIPFNWGQRSREQTLNILGRWVLVSGRK